jgi:hypothetical protein
MVVDAVFGYVLPSTIVQKGPLTVNPGAPGLSRLTEILVMKADVADDVVMKLIRVADVSLRVVKALNGI